MPVIFERVASNCQYAGSKPLSSTVGIQMGALARRSIRRLRGSRHNEFVPDSWPVVCVDDWSVAGLETQGQHPHDWLKHSSQKRTWLFKPARPERDRLLGEDVAEKLASELARLRDVSTTRGEAHPSCKC